MNIPSRIVRPKLTYEEYEVYIDAAVQTGFGMTLDQMRMHHGYFISPCNCEENKCYPLCRGWILCQDRKMAADISPDSDQNPLYFFGEEFYPGGKDDD